MSYQPLGMLAPFRRPVSRSSRKFTCANVVHLRKSLPFPIAMATVHMYSICHVYRRGIGQGDSGIGGSLGCGHAPVARMHSPIRCGMRMGTTRGNVVCALVVVANWARPGHRAREGARGACARQLAHHRCRLEVGQAVLRAMWMTRALTRPATPETEAKLLDAAMYSSGAQLERLF